MKPFGAIVAAAALLAVPALADTYEKRVTESETTTVAPASPPAAVVVEPQTAQDPFPHQGSDNPSGLVGQDDFQDEGKQLEGNKGPGNPETAGNPPGRLDPQEVPDKKSDVIIVK